MFLKSNILGRENQIAKGVRNSLGTSSLKLACVAYAKGEKAFLQKSD